MKAYSYDLRQCVIRAVDQGRSQAEIVTMFALSWATRKRYLKLQRETGNVQAKPIPGRPSKKGTVSQAGLPSQLEASPDATRAEQCRLWETTRGVQVSSATMSRAIQRLNWTRKKKTLRASEQKEEERAAWREQAQTLDAGTLVFLDECGSNRALTRLSARSPQGKRAYGTIPRNRRANITLLASLSLQGVGEAFLLEGSADGQAFEIDIEQLLAPSLQAGQIVVLDNLSTHTGERGRQAIEARGCRLLFLPSDSADLPPIEEASSKLKAFWHRMGARTPEALQEAIGEALLTITAHDALGWFTHCGYRSLSSSVSEWGCLAYQAMTTDVCLKRRQDERIRCGAQARWGRSRCGRNVCGRHHWRRPVPISAGYGLDAARARGRTGGRRKASETLRPEQLARAREFYAAQQNSVAEIMSLTGFKSRATLYKYVVSPEKLK